MTCNICLLSSHAHCASGSSVNNPSESESDIYSATINEDYYAEAGVVSKGSVHRVIERICSGKMKS